MIFTIDIDTSKPLSEQDLRILRAFLPAAPRVGEQGPETHVPKTADTVKPPAVKTPAPAAEPAVEEPAAAPEPAAEAPAEPAVEEASAPEPEIPAGSNRNPTMAEAVARATELVSAGKTARVREVLQGLNVARVSELKTPLAIESFLHALQG